MRTAWTCTTGAGRVQFTSEALHPFIARVCVSLNSALSEQRVAMTFRRAQGATLASSGADLGVHGYVVLLSLDCTSPWNQSCLVRDEMVTGMSPMCCICTPSELSPPC